MSGLSLRHFLHEQWRYWPGPYTTTKSVRIYDTRLRYSQLAALLGVLLFILIEVLLLHKNCIFESPVGTINVWSQFADAPAGPAGRPKPIFCDNPEYDFLPTGQDLLLTGGLTSSNSSCPHVNTAEMTQVEMSGISLTTWSTRIIINTTCPDPSMGSPFERSDWAQTGTEAPVDGPLYCKPVESSRKSYFNARIDEVPISTLHAFSTSWGLTGTSVHTRLWRKDGSLYREIPAGIPVAALTVVDYLAMADASLDARNEQSLAFSTSPHYRLSGMVLLAKIKYSNRRSWDTDTEVRADMTVEVVPMAWGYTGAKWSWLSYPHVQLLEHVTAVQIRFVIEGQLGRSDYFTLILQIMAAAFLLTVARELVDLIGQYMLADRESFVAAKWDTLELNRNSRGDPRSRITGGKGGDSAAAQGAVSPWTPSSLKQHAEAVRLQHRFPASGARDAEVAMTSLQGVAKSKVDLAAASDGSGERPLHSPSRYVDDDDSDHEEQAQHTRYGVRPSQLQVEMQPSPLVNTVQM